MNRVLAVVIALGACGKSDTRTGPSADEWEAATSEAAPMLAKLRGRLLAVKAEIDKQPDASKYPACTPSPEYRYHPVGAPSEHTIDFLYYDGLGGDGDRPHDGAVFHTIESSSLMRILSLTMPKSMTPQEPIAFERLRAVGGLRTVVVVKQRPDSDPANVKEDSFVASLEPAKIVCTITLAVSSEVKGTAATTYTEVTMERKTGKIVDMKQKTEGGLYQDDASFYAMKSYGRRTWEALGVTAATCQQESDCGWFKGTHCVEYSCVR